LVEKGRREDNRDRNERVERNRPKRHTDDETVLAELFGIADVVFRHYPVAMLYFSYPYNKGSGRGLDKIIRLSDVLSDIYHSRLDI
jgi:hypothetical protein